MVREVFEPKFRKFLDDRPSINIKKLEGEAGIPEGTFYHFLAGRRGIPNHLIKNIHRVIIRYGFNLN
jgi:predicted transcriptional regulator